MGKVIDVDEDLYNGISSSIKGLADTLNGARGNLEPCFSGELASYYEGNCNTELSRKASEVVEDIENVSLAIDSSVDLYKKTDEELLYDLDDLINDIFELNLEVTETDYIPQDGEEGRIRSLEDRKRMIQNLITKYEETYEALKNQYEELYGDGIKFDKQKALEMMNLFASLGLFTGAAGTAPSDYSEEGVLRIKDGEIRFDINQTAAFLKDLKEKNITDSIKKYFETGDWNSSGMEELFGEKLRAQYYGRHQNDIHDDEMHTDAETIFLENYINGCYATLRKSGNIDYSSAHSDFGQFVNDFFLDDNNPDSLYDILESFDNTFESCDDFSGFIIKNKESAKLYILEYLRRKNIFESIDNLEAKSVECTNLQNDLIALSNTLYNYKQAALLLPYESYMEDDAFQEFLDNEYYSSDYLGLKIQDSEYLNPKEIELYNYLYRKVSPFVADNYLKALTDTINNRKGMVEALKYIRNLEKGGYHFDDELSAMFEGFKDGTLNFLQGLERFFKPSGTRSILDYAIYYKTALLSNPDQFNLNINLTEAERNALNLTYNIFSGVGNMAIPQIISLIGVGISAITKDPTIAEYFRKFSQAIMAMSVAGNSTNAALVEGYSIVTAYLYGGLTGASEVLFEKLGGILGIGDNVDLMGKTQWDAIKKFIYSMFNEGREEFFQEFFDAGLRAILLGEPLDLGQTTRDAFMAGLYGMAVAGIMNANAIVIIKIGGKILKLRYGDLASINLEDIDTDEKLEEVLEELQVDTLQEALDIINNNNIEDFEDVLDYIKYNSLTKEQSSDLLNAYLQSITKDLKNDRSKIVKIYSELMKLLHYDENADINQDPSRLDSNMTILDLDGKDVVCTEFTTIFADLLYRAGIDDSKIKLMNQGKGHMWLQVTLDDGRVLIADATNSIYGRTDLTSGKAGLDFVGLVILDPEFAGVSLRDIYLSAAGKNPDPSLNTPEMQAKAKAILDSGYANIRDVISEVGELNIGAYEVVATLVSGSEDLSVDEKIKIINKIGSEVDLTSIEWLQIIRKIFKGDEIVESAHVDKTGKSYAIIRDKATGRLYRITIINGDVQIEYRD